MKKTVIISLLFFISLPLRAMEAPEPEANYVLSKQKAEEFYLETAENQQDMPYRTYKKIMMRLIPIIKFTQRYYHNPLHVAVSARDIDFVQFLLDYGANPYFKAFDDDINAKNAYDALQEPPGLPLPSKRELDELIDEGIFTSEDVKEYQRIREYGDLNNDIIESLLNSISAA